MPRENPSRSPLEQPDEVSQLQEDVLERLEQSNVPSPLCERIMGLIYEWERNA